MHGMIIVSFLTAKLYHYDADCAIKSTLCIIACMGNQTQEKRQEMKFMEKKNQNTNKKIIQTSNKQVHQMRDTRTKNASQKRSKKHRKKQVFGRQSIFAGGFCIVAALAIVIGIFVSNKTKTPYEKQVITLYEKEILCFF